MNNNSLARVILLSLGLFAIFKPIGLDPDSSYYYDWVVNDFYNELEIEASFKHIASFVRLFFDGEIAYRAVNGIYVILITLMLLSNPRSLRHSHIIYVYIFVCYLSLTFTQIRFGLGYTAFLYAFYTLVDQKNIQRFLIASIISILSHYAMVIPYGILFLAFIFTRFTEKYKIYILIILFLAIAIILSTQLTADKIEGLTANFDLSGRIKDNLNNIEKDYTYFISTNLYVISTFLWWVTFSSTPKDSLEHTFTILVGSIVLLTTTFHILHIRLFQIYAVISISLILKSYRALGFDYRLKSTAIILIPTIFGLNDFLFNW